MQQVATSVHIDMDGTLAIKQQCEVLWQHLGQIPDPVLIVFDNFSETEPLQPWLPIGANLKVLVTTRRRDLAYAKIFVTFFENDEELKRAKIEQLEGIISTLPWIATIDAFQHWIYENPTHTVEERTAQWKILSKRFGTGMVDQTGYEEIQENSWQRQLHLYEVPFYYIEYGFAQLGAIAVWKNYLEDKEEGLKLYKEALSAGYTVSIPEVYKKAGVQFDFSQEYVKSLFDFLKIELKKLEE